MSFTCLLRSLKAITTRTRDCRKRRCWAVKPWAEVLEERLSPAVIYDYSLIAQSGQSGLIGIDTSTSINDAGKVAFVGRQDHGDSLFVGGEPSTFPLRNITPATGNNSNIDFRPTIQINNRDQVAAVDQRFGGRGDFEVQLWDARKTDSATPLLTNGGFDRIFAPVSVNAAGATTFVASQGTRVTLQRVVNPGIAGQVDPVVLPSPQPFLRPSIADDGSIVMRADYVTATRNNSPINLYVPQSFGYDTEPIAALPRFTNLGSSPGISRDGKVVAFSGELTAQGAQEINSEQPDQKPLQRGAGIFVSIADANGNRVIVRVAGAAGNGILDPGEGGDTNGDGQIDGTEMDTGLVKSFDVNSRVGVAARQDGKGWTVAYVGFTPAGDKALFTSPVTLPADQSQAYQVKDGPSVVVRVGQTVPVNGQEQVLQDLAVYDPINTHGQVAFWAQVLNGGQEVLRANPVRTPVLVVPGVGGSFPAASAGGSIPSASSQDYKFWLTHLGVSPDKLQIDPLFRVYADLIQSLMNAGYQEGKDLFIATYDWRLPLAPTDGVPDDGKLTSVTAGSIDSDIRSSTFNYGVDYLGYWLQKAADAWEQRFPGQKLDKLDVVALSMGGLLTRSYIQSDAYGGDYGGGKTLPKIDHFVMIGTPNQGASKAWNPLHDNFINDIDNRVATSKVFKSAYAFFQNGGIIRNPDGTPLTIRDHNGQPLIGPFTPDSFLSAYFPGQRALLPTYAFFYNGDGQPYLKFDPDPAESTVKNDLLVDLNAGVGGLNDQLATRVGKVTVVYGTNFNPKGLDALYVSGTPTYVFKETGPQNSRLGPYGDIFSFTTNGWLARKPRDGESWFQDIGATDGGDGTVPLVSSRDLFVGDSRYDLQPFTQGFGPALGPASNTTGDVQHSGMLANRDVEGLVLSIFGHPLDPAQISTGNQRTRAQGILAYLLDPVDGVLVDGNGKRLGFSPTDGPVAEIPDSLYFGDNADGIGFVFGNVTTPLGLQLTGLGQTYAVEVAGFQGRSDVSFGQSGTLANGQTAQIPLTLDPFLQQADLGVTQSPSSSHALVGDLLTYHITVTNNGPADAPQVLLTDALPAGARFVSADASQGTFKLVDGNVAFDVGPVAHGVQAVLSVTVRLDSAGTVTNTVSVTGASTEDPTPGNDTATQSVQVDVQNIPLPLETIFRALPALVPDTANGDSGLNASAVSADGRYVAFESVASNLVPGQVSNRIGMTSVYLYDRVAGTVALVSHTASAPATSANNNAASPEISADGRYVVYTSYATNLVTGESNAAGNLNVYLYDRVTGSNLLISHAAGTASTTVGGNADSGGGSGEEGSRLSADGRYVGYTSRATDLVAGLTNTRGGFADLFLYDQQTGTTRLVSHTTASSLTEAHFSDRWALSADGRYLAFRSQSHNLVAGENYTHPSGSFDQDLYLYDQVADTMTLVSRAAGAPTTTSNGNSGFPTLALSADGRYTLFASNSTTLVAGQVNPNSFHPTEVFVFDRTTGQTTLVSHTSGTPTTEPNQASDYAALSTDGRFVAYQSRATNLIVGQRPNASGGGTVFLSDLQTGTTVMVSHAAGSTTTPGRGSSENPQISADGRYVAFTSGAVDLVAGETNGHPTGPLSNPRDVFLYDAATGTSILVSHAATSPTTTADLGSEPPVISADGRFVVYASLATNLATGLTDTNHHADLFLYDRAAGTSAAASRHAPLLGALTGNQRTEGPPGLIGVESDAVANTSVSADGRFVAFTSEATNLIAGQMGAGENVFLLDRKSGVITLVSHAAGSATTRAFGRSFGPVLSADGRYVAYVSTADNLVAGETNSHTNQFTDTYLYDRVTEINTLVSHASNSATTTGQVPSNVADIIGSFSPVISSDGRHVAYVSGATNLVAGESVNTSIHNVYLYDRVTGTNTLVSHRSDSATTTANVRSGRPVLSADGRYVAYVSGSTDLVAGQQVNPNQVTADYFGDVFLYDGTNNTNTLVSHTSSSSTTGGIRSSVGPVLSADGHYLAFQSNSTDLIPGLVHPGATGRHFVVGFDIFLYDTTTGVIALVSHTPGTTTHEASGGSSGSIGPLISADGRFVAFDSDATDLVSGQKDTNNNRDVFLYDRVAGTNQLVSHVPGSAVTAGGQASTRSAIGPDGNLIAFTNAGTDLIAGLTNTNNGSNVFLYNRTADTVTLISGSGTVTTGNNTSQTPVLSGSGNYLAFNSDASNLVSGDYNDQSDEFGANLSAPTASIAPIQPAPRTTPVTSITITFSAPVRGFKLSDLTLSHDGGANLLTTAQTLTQAPDGKTWTLANVKALTGAVGRYRLTLTAAGSSVANPFSKLPLTGDASTTWAVSSFPPPVVMGSEPAGSSPTNAASVDFNVSFSQDVTGVTADDFRPRASTGISGAAVTGVRGSGASYTVTVATGTGSGTLGLDVTDDDSVVSGLGLPLGGAGAGNGDFTVGRAYAITKTVPSTTEVMASASSSVFGQRLTFTATVRPALADTRVPSGTVVFKEGDTILDTEMLSAGQATFYTSVLPASSHTITAAYRGDDHFSNSSGDGAPVSVDRAPTSASLSVSSSSGTVGESIIFTITVAGPAGVASPSRGGVAFLDGTQDIGAGTLSNGQASFSTAGLAVGPHSIMARYDGDPNFLGSTSNPVPLTVNKIATTTALQPPPASVLIGQQVTFTATVAAAAGTGQPAGRVTFREGTTVFQVVDLQNGTAVFATAVLPAGSHTIMATYNGDPTFALSISGPVSVAVSNPSVPPPSSPATPSPAAPHRRGYVEQVYLDLLTRAVDAPSLAGWLRGLGHGLPPSWFVLRLEHSKEYRVLLVRQLVRQFLHRRATADDFFRYLPMLAAGDGSTVVKASILATPEYFTKRGGGNGLGFLQALAQDLLQKPLPAPGEEGIEDLNGAGSRFSASLVVLTSQPARERLVRRVYKRYLHAQIPKGLLSYYTGLMQNGAGEEIVIAKMLSSREYLALL